MKRIATVSVAALIALTGAASAAKVTDFVPEADLSGYSAGAIAAINSELNSTEDDSFVEKRAQVRSLLKNLQ